MIQNAVLATWMLWASPWLPDATLPSELCAAIQGVRIEAESQAAFQVVPTPPREQGGTRWRDVVAFEGEPLRLRVGLSISRHAPPSAGVVAKIRLDSAIVATVHFARWSRHGGGSGAEPYLYIGEAVQLAVPSLARGEHSLTASVRGCDPTRWWHHRADAIAVHARSTQAPHDLAERSLYRAHRRIHTQGDCATAKEDLDVAARFKPEHVVVLGLRALCAERGGSLREALGLYQRAESALLRWQSDWREANPANAVRVFGFGSDIARVSGKLEQQGGHDSAK